MTQEEKIKDLEHRIELMNDGQSELVKQLEHFRNMASGYKGRNAQFQEEVKKLKEQVKHYKELDLEGDELNEQRLKELAEKDKVIRGLQEQVNYLTQKYTKMTNTLDELRDENTRLNNDLKLAKMPWWKKVF